MSYRVAAAFVTVGLVAVAGCEMELPTAPSDLMEGVVVYEHADYAGQSAHLTSDVSDLGEFSGPCEKFHAGTGPGDPGSTEHSWDDCISSIRLGPGAGAILYKDDGFDGEQFRVTQDLPNLTTVRDECDKGGFNDCVTSIRVTRAVRPATQVTSRLQRILIVR